MRTRRLASSTGTAASPARSRRSLSPWPILGMAAAVTALFGATPVVAASEGHWPARAVEVQLGKNGTPFWGATVTYAPTFSYTPSNGSVYLTFGGTLVTGAPSNDCLDAAGRDSCAARWQYPAQHVTAATLTFDTGAVTTRGSSEPYFGVPPGATRITGLGITVGDAVHDVGDAPTTAVTLSFGEAFDLADGKPLATSVASPAMPAPAVGQSSGWGVLGWAAAPAAVLLGTVGAAAALARSRRGRPRPPGERRTASGVDGS